MRLIAQQFLIPAQKYIDLTLTSSELILSICNQLNLNIQSFHYSCWIFHCNISIKSFHSIDRYLAICASIVLGMKIGECLKRVEDVIVVWRKHVRKHNKKKPQLDDQQTMKRLKHKVLDSQVYLMMTFSFDLDINLALEYLKEVQDHMQPQFFKQARRAITDFYKTQLIVYYPPHLIALASIRIAREHTHHEISTGCKPWYKAFSDQTQLEEVQSLVKTIYDYLKLQPSTQQIQHM